MNLIAVVPTFVLLATSTAVNTKEDEPCGLWVAKSTIPGANLGMFNGDDAIEIGGTVDWDQVAIPLHEVEWHNGGFKDNRHVRKNWLEYWMMFTIEPFEFGIEMEVSEDNGVFASGAGALVNCHFALNSVDEPVTLSYDSLQLHRSKDPGCGAFSGYHKYQCPTIRKIPAGAEIFGSYGENWFIERHEKLGDVPFERDWEAADEFLNDYKTFLSQHGQHISEDLKNIFFNLFKETQVEDFDAKMIDFAQLCASRKIDHNVQKEMVNLLEKCLDLEFRTIEALPRSLSDLQEALEIGIFELEQRKATRSKEWLRENGKCLDNIIPGNSTIPQAGRGAFAARFIPEGGLVGHAPLLHAPDKSMFNMYAEMADGSGRRDISQMIGSQVLVNYCFGHRHSSMLLCPYGSTTPYINHSSKESNAKIIWAKDTQWFDEECLKKTPEALLNQVSTCLAIDYIATRDIREGEEVLIDYGAEWEESWNNHLRSWTPTEGSEGYERASVLNGKKESIRTKDEQIKDPYPDNVASFCHDGDDDAWYPCDIIERIEVGDTILYNVNLYIKFESGEIEKTPLHGLGVEDILLVDRLSTGDEFLPNAFRHSMAIPDDMFPEIWMNTIDGTCSTEEDYTSCSDDQREEVKAEPTREHVDNDGEFKASPLEPGEIQPVVWRDTGEEVNKYAVRIGIQPKLTRELRAYADLLGITDIYWSLEYTNPIAPGNYRLLELRYGDKRKNQWYINRPESKWNSNMHWAGPADEYGHEEYLKILAAGGFDEVLEAVGNYYNLDGLFVQGVGFIGVSHCSRGYIHQDMTETGGKFFNVLIPLMLVEGAAPEFILQDDHGRIGAAKYAYSEAFMVGDDAYHGTEACDYRSTKGMRMGASIYIADINNSNAEIITSDTTTIFPVPEDIAWAMAQKGRHWGGNNSLVGDRGRKSFEIEDEWESCPELVKQGMCETDIWNTRLNCVKSCNIYMEGV